LKKRKIAEKLSILRDSVDMYRPPQEMPKKFSSTPSIKHAAK